MINYQKAEKELQIRIEENSTLAEGIQTLKEEKEQLLEENEKLSVDLKDINENFMKIKKIIEELETENNMLKEK